MSSIRPCIDCSKKLDRNLNTIWRMLMTDGPTNTSYTLYYCNDCFAKIAGLNYMDKIIKLGLKR